MKVWPHSDSPTMLLTEFARSVSLQFAMIGLSVLAVITPSASNCFGQFTEVDASSDSDQGHSILLRESDPSSAFENAMEPVQKGATPRPYSDRRPIEDNSAAQLQPRAARPISTETNASGFIPSGTRPNPMLHQDDRDNSMPSSSRRGASTGTLRPANVSADNAPAFTPTRPPVFTPRPAAATQATREVVRLPKKQRNQQTQEAGTNNGVIVDSSLSPVSYAAPVQSLQGQTRRPLQSIQPRQNPGQVGQANRNNGQSNQAAASAAQQPDRSSKKTSSTAKVLIARFGAEASQTGKTKSENLIPLRLADVLNQGQIRANRGQLVNQYWDTFESWARTVSANQHRDWVNELRVSKSTDQSTFGVAKSNAENEVAAGRIALNKSQAKLKSILGTVASIVPADLPTVTMVKTNFQAFKERGLIPSPLEGIDQTLTDLHDLILSRADTVLLAERTAEQVKGYYRSNQATIEQLLGAGRAWRSAEADFIASTIEYNKAYAEYALALPYGQAPVEQVVAMLVVPAKATPTASPSPAGADARQAQLPRTPAASNRPSPQRRRGNTQIGQDSTVRAASSGFGGASVPQSPATRPMQSFSSSSNSTSTDASFGLANAREFSANSSTAQSNQPANRPSPVSFGSGSSGSAMPENSRGNTPPAAGGFAFGQRGGSSPAAATPSTSGFSGGQSPSRGFDSRTNNTAAKPSTDPFSSRTAAQPTKKSATVFGGGQNKNSGSQNKNLNQPQSFASPAGSRANNGFSSGFSR